MQSVKTVRENIFKLILCTLLPALFFACGGEKGTITADGVNLRSYPTTTSPVVKTLNAQERVSILEKREVKVSPGSGVAGLEGVFNKNANILCGGKLYPMNYGKSVQIVSLEGNYYIVNFDAYGHGIPAIRGMVAVENIDVLYISKWFKVRAPSGAEGWVFGRFLSRE